MTNYCVSITKTLMMGVKLMTERHKKNTRIRSKGQCKVKQRSERNQRFPFNSSEVKQRSARSSEEKQRSKRSQRFHFNSSESKTA